MNPFYNNVHSWHQLGSITLNCASGKVYNKSKREVHKDLCPRYCTILICESKHVHFCFVCALLYLAPRRSTRHVLVKRGMPLKVLPSGGSKEIFDLSPPPQRLATYANSCCPLCPWEPQSVRRNDYGPPSCISCDSTINDLRFRTR